MTKNILLSVIILLFSSSAMSEQAPLSILVDGNGCPTAVSSPDDSCTAGQPDALNIACRSNGAVVRFESEGNSIESISHKLNSVGTFHNCRQAGPRYQCVVRGNVSERVDYNVKLQGCVEMDPTIIIK